MGTICSDGPITGYSFSHEVERNPSQTSFSVNDDVRLCFDKNSGTLMLPFTQESIDELVHTMCGIPSNGKDVRLLWGFVSPWSYFPSVKEIVPFQTTNPISVAPAEILVPPSVARIFTALYSAGGPKEHVFLREGRYAPFEFYKDADKALAHMMRQAYGVPEVAQSNNITQIARRIFSKVFH